MSIATIPSLTNRVIVQKLTTTPDSYNEIDSSNNENWSTVSSVYADYRPLTGYELLKSQQVNPEITSEMIVRHSKTINAENRVLYRRLSTQLNGALTAEQLTVTVDDAVALSASERHLLLIESELVEVTAGTGTVSLTVRRGACGTTAATHVDNTKVHVMGVLKIDSIYDALDNRQFLTLRCVERS